MGSLTPATTSTSSNCCDNHNKSFFWWGNEQLSVSYSFSLPLPFSRVSYHNFIGTLIAWWKCHHISAPSKSYWKSLKWGLIHFDPKIFPIFGCWYLWAFDYRIAMFVCIASYLLTFRSFRPFLLAGIFLNLKYFILLWFFLLLQPFLHLNFLHGWIMI